MKFNKLYFEIYKDLFGYHNEIKKINSGYRLYFNKKQKKFVIVNFYNNFEICATYNSISEINLYNLRFLKIENYEKIINSIDFHNQKLEDKYKQNRQNQMQNIIKEYKKLTLRSTSTNQTDINKIIGAIIC